MHLLPGLHRKDEANLSELRRRAGGASTAQRFSFVGVEKNSVEEFVTGNYHDSRSLAENFRGSRSVARRSRWRDGADSFRPRDGPQILELLSALQIKGETVEELVGFATAMRRHATKIFPRDHSRVNEPLVDTCGTGGDAKGTFNVSTAAAFVVAGAGVRVAKHGNRSISSKCGSADVLEALGVRIDLEPERVAQSIDEIGIGFLFAPAMHAATRHAMPARRQLRGRTVFNLLGPLTNPAGASAQVAGVYDAGFTDLMARALGELGVKRAFVVHGADGMDEISIGGETNVAELRDGIVRSYTIVPEDFGLRRAPLESILGGDAKHNALIIHKVLGRPLMRHELGPHRDIVRANAAAALVAAGRATDWLDGVRIATESIDSGAARERLERLVAFTQAEKGNAHSAI
jgi:anthranilate phosphoribosyltransferase